MKKAHWGISGIREVVLSIVTPFLGALFTFTDLISQANVLSLESKILIFFSLEFLFLIAGMLTVFWIKDLNKACVLATLALILVASFNSLQNTIMWICPLANRLRYIAPVYIVMGTVILYSIGRAKRGLKIVAWCIDAILIAMALYITVVTITTGENNYNAEDENKSTISAIAKVALPYKPDVYYIVLDAYTSSESLGKYWGYDNSGFERALGKQGFVIAKRSRASYCETQTSMDSTLNMSSPKTQKSRTLSGSLEAIKNNETTSRFKKMGYDIVNYSPFDIGKETKYYSYVFSNPYVSSFEDAMGKLVNGSLPMVLMNGIGYYKEDIAEINMRILREVAQLRSSHSERPIYVYAHILLPHGPSTLYADGRLIPDRKRAQLTEKSYVEQIKGTNIVVMKMISVLLSKYPEDRKPIIVLQGDHGYRMLKRKESRRKEKLTIFNAYLLPGQGGANVSQAIRPYETFRMIFETYF